MTDPVSNPPGIDLASLTAQILQDGVVVDQPELEGAIQRALAQVSDTPPAYVMLPEVPLGGPQLRDVAQDLQLATGADTVIVRTPSMAIGVSESLTRAQVELGQRAMAVQPDYAQGVRDFYAAADTFQVPWGLVAVLALVLLTCTGGATVASARRVKA